MTPMLLAVAFQLSAAAPAGDDMQLINPRAIELFEGDSTLIRWAVNRFDEDADRYLSISEADKAAREFKRIADGDADGRVTPAEYRSARDFIVARYAAVQSR